MPHFTIDEVYSKGDTYPLIVNFQNGYSSENFQTQECVVLQDETSKAKTVVTDIDNFLYAGEEITNEPFKTIILARNKDTGKVRLIEVGSVNLKPIIKTDLDTTQALETDTSTLELSRKFGSKKLKQIVEHREKLKVSSETVNKQIENVTMNLTENQLDLSSYNKNDSNEFYIPNINRDATKVEDVYDINDILTTEEFEKINRELEGSEYEAGFNDFLSAILTKDLSETHKVLAVYANTLLSMYFMAAKDITKKNFVACPYSTTLNEIVIANFLSNINGRRGRSPQYKDKTLCHAIVFILLLNNFKFNLEDFSKHLKLTPRSVATKASITGASIVTLSNKKVVQLKLPLSKPPSRRVSAKF